MSTVGQIEKKTQQRVVKLFREHARLRLPRQLDRPRRQPQHRGSLAARLSETSRATTTTLINRALYHLDKAAGDTSKSLYDRNRAVYDLLRYGVKVKPGVGREHA